MDNEICVGDIFFSNGFRIPRFMKITRLTQKMAEFDLYKGKIMNDKMFFDSDDYIPHPDFKRRLEKINYINKMITNGKYIKW